MDLPIVTYASNPSHPGVSKLRKSLSGKGFKLFVLCKRSKEPFRWIHKVHETQSCLRSQIKSELVVVCDAYDVRFLGVDRDELIARYHELVPDGDKILFCGERKYRHHHRDIAEGDWETNGVYRFPSSCIMMGPRKLLLELYDWMAMLFQRHVYDATHERDAFCQCGRKTHKGVCDQSMITYWLFETEKGIIDTEARVFWSARGEVRHFLKKYAKPIRVDKTPRLRNLTTETLPMMLHVPPEQPRTRRRLR